MQRSRKNRMIYTVLMVTAVVLFWVVEQYVLPSLKAESDVEETNLPAFILPGTEAGDVITHGYYALEYAELHEQPQWVAYALTRSQLTSDDRKRPFFIEDPKVRTASADWRNYKNSGYDRGHLCPAGDRRFSEIAYNETFYTSNISPMKPDFNAGIWNRLEIQVRDWARQYDTLYVITGGVLKRGLPSIGYERVSVPESFFKIVVRGRGKEMESIAFLIPHRESSRSPDAFRVSIDQLEEETGINFFESLEDSLEVRLEEGVNGSHWPF